MRVCRTDQHVCDGELAHPKEALVPGHEVVGVVDALGSEVDGLEVGQRVGIPWLGWTCGDCVYCRAGQENLCETARFTGNTLDGGYADDALADVRYVFPIHGDYTDAEAFLALAPKVPVCTRVETFPLERANEVLDRLRDGRLQGAAVLTIE